MATIATTFPVPVGSQVTINAALGPYAAGTQGYLCFYEQAAAGSATLIAIVRVPDDVLGTFDLKVAIDGITELE